MSILKAIEQHADAHIGLPAVEFIREITSPHNDIIIEEFECCGCHERIFVKTVAPLDRTMGTEDAA